MTFPLPRTSRRAMALTTSDARPSWYRVDQPVALVGEDGDSATSADVYVYETIGGWLGMTADDFIRDVASLDVDRIVLHLNTPGGDVFEAVAMANVLRSHRASIKVVVDGIAASAGTVIAMAGDEIVMGVGSQMMIHDAWGFCVGNAADMTKTAEMLATTSDSIASTYAARAGGTAAAWRAVMVEEQWYTAEEAVEAGLADRISTADDNGSATGEQVVPGGSGGLWDLWDSYRSQDRFDLTVFAHAGRENAPAPAMPAGHRSPAASAAGTTTQERSPAVAFSDEQLTTLRQRVGVAEDADEATILAALEEALNERAEPQQTNHQLPDGIVSVDAEQLAQLRADAAAGREAHTRQEREERERLVNAAVTDGRIPPARRDAWLAQLEADPGAAEALASLAPGLVPVAPVGHDVEPDPADVRETPVYKNWSV